MFQFYPKYAALSDNEDIGDNKGDMDSRTASWIKARFSSGTALILSIVVHLLILIFIIIYVSRPCKGSRNAQLFPQTLYCASSPVSSDRGRERDHTNMYTHSAPVQDNINYQLTTFESGFHGGQYIGRPNIEIDTRWKELYRVGNSRISKSEASQLPNKTIAAIAGEEDYLVVISVFHDLHCLVSLLYLAQLVVTEIQTDPELFQDRLRQSMWYFSDDRWNSTYNPYTIPRPATYSPDGLNGIKHLDHCINILRQSLQCFSDVSPYVFQWDEGSQEVKAYANVVHTCRNFEAVSRRHSSLPTSPLRSSSPC